MRYRLLLCALVFSACTLHPMTYETAIVAGRDAGREVGRDAGRDAGPDAGRDLGRDAGGAAPARAVPLYEQVSVVTQVRGPASEAGSRHSVRWQWFEGEALLLDRSRTLEFGAMPYRILAGVAASDLGVGHYRVEVSVDGRRVDAQSFEIVAR